MKYFATTLLLFTFMIYLSSSYMIGASSHVFWPALRAFSEAALIGALADWFAVVALFRHPLGLPIPHTAILARRKDEIGEALASFIRDNFLTVQTIRNKVISMRPSELLTNYLRERSNSLNVSRKIIQLSVEVIRTSADQVTTTFMAKFIEVSAAQGMNLAKIAGQVLIILLRADKHEIVSRGLLTVISRLLSRHEEFLKRIFNSSRPWYVPRFVENHLYRSFVRQVSEAISRVNSSEGAPLRSILREDLNTLAEFLLNDPGASRLGLEFGTWLFQSAETKNALSQLAEALLSSHEEDSIKFLADLLELFATVLSENPEMQDKFDAQLCRLAEYLTAHHADDLLRIISDTVRTWDSKTFIEKLESHLWRDLQFIRVNGTLVGGMIGLILFVISRATGLG